ncbi:MAG TPA: response regulator [Elusimicrobiota bacterium]|jgi:DNA-binding response OmpR family regulator|nr:response regulator [Elusimicrobiota bacterium]HMU95925.1 response regulator [Elusimicrobiota bacterium]HMX42200.1 response regulator [Elusimicrobiota bacterium]HMX95167.1 response regulator [Elusimicrobiota bacterium]HMZ26121.1 response regulator [Elusimicrobiota bacterium]
MAKKRVLIIDDDPAMSGLLEEFCVEMGCDVLCVNDSRHAFEAVRRFQPDLITLDLEMPHKDGLELLREFRADPQAKTIPVLIVSIMAQEAPIAAEAVLGKLTKPVPFGTFLDKVRKLLIPAIS